MLQAGVILSDYATLMVEILKDNARAEDAAVYGMPWRCPGPNSWGRSRRPTPSKSLKYIDDSPAVRVRLLLMLTVFFAPWRVMVSCCAGGKLTDRCR
jgi:hypothetical protein